LISTSFQFSLGRVIVLPPEGRSIPSLLPYHSPPLLSSSSSSSSPLTMGARQSMDDRPRSNSVDTASSNGGMAGLAGSRLGEPRGTSRSVLSTTDIVHAMRRAEEAMRGSDDEEEAQPGPSRPPIYPRDGHSRRSHPTSSSSQQRRQLRQHMRRSFFMLDIDCPICKKRVPSDEADVHLVMCLTRPKITYNEDILCETKGRVFHLSGGYGEWSHDCKTALSMHLP
ncbi:hypothetical protein PENTCL1PPCAC_23012, partial [Pristionchus entomophagus]